MANSQGPPQFLFRINNVSRNQSIGLANGLGPLQETFVKGGKGGVLAVARLGDTIVWRISSNENERPTVFVPPPAVPAEEDNISLSIFLDLVVEGLSKHKCPHHFVIWNRGSFVPRLVCATDAPGATGQQLQHNTKTFVSGHGYGVVIELGKVRLWLRPGLSNPTTLVGRPSVPNHVFETKQARPIMTPELNGHTSAHIVVRGGGYVYEGLDGPDQLGLLTVNMARSRVVAFKHLKMANIKPFCIASKLRDLTHHLNILRYEDWCPLGRFLVRPYVPCPPITQESCQSSYHILKMTSDMVRALEHLQNHDMVHGNIRPANIFCVTTAQEVRYVLTDFGLTGAHNPIPAANFHYTAPEILDVMNTNPTAKSLAKQYRHKSDIWSLGVVILQMIYASSPSTWGPEVVTNVNAWKRTVMGMKDGAHGHRNSTSRLWDFLDNMVCILPHERKAAHELATDLLDCPDLNP